MQLASDVHPAQMHLPVFHPQVSQTGGQLVRHPADCPASGGTQYHHSGAEDQVGWHPAKLAAVQIQSRRQSLPRRGKKLQLATEKCNDRLWLFSSSENPWN